MDESLLKQAKAYKTEYSKKKRWQKIVAVLCLAVALCTFYALSEPATTMQQQVYCGLEEHLEHSDSCYNEEGELICGMEEHAHGLQCYSDPEADIESSDIWMRSFANAELTDDICLNAAEIAKTQLGYSESEANYLVAEGNTVCGYTRYGDWYGDRYAKWDALFCQFCYSYAGATEENVPFEADCRSLMAALEEAERFMGTDYIPKVGDLAFFKSETKLYQVGLITEVKLGNDGALLGIVTVDGDYNNSVSQNERAADDLRLYGYGVFDAQQSEEKAEALPEPTPTPEPTQRPKKAALGATLGATPSVTGITDQSKLSNSGTYYLTKDITINTTVEISSGKNVTLDLNGHNITGSANPMFKISGGTLTIEDSNPKDTVAETVSGNTFGQVASYNSNTKTLTYYKTLTSVVTGSTTGETAEKTEKHTVTGGMIIGNKNGRAFEVSGGTLNLEGGCICNFGNLDEGGAIYQNGGTVNINGAVLAANSANNHGGAIYLTGSNSTLNIKNGAIAGNSAYYDGGGGVCAVGSAKVNMSGGYVTNNLATGDDYFQGGGGVLLQSAAQFNLSGGYITSNKAAGGGGGIKTWQDWGGNNTGRVNMSGGFVTANNCLHAEGAGMNINAGGALRITAGYITNNVLGGGINDSNFSDWGGGGIFCAENTASSVVNNALITDNSAGGFGGGVAGCATGRIVTSDKGDGAAIFDNYAKGENTSGSASTKNEDHQYAAESEVFMSHGYQDYFCALASNVSNSMLGGGLEQWEGSSDGVPVSASTASDRIIGGYVTGLTSHASDADKSKAESVAKVFINGNESPTHGGGILVNGYLVMGTVDNFEVYTRLELKPLNKKYVDAAGNDIPMGENAFRFVVVDQYGEIVSEGSNTAEGQVVFDRMLPFTDDGTYNYTLYELPPDDDAVLYDTSRYNMTVTVYREENNGDKVPWTDIQIVRYKFSNVTITETTSNSQIYNADPGDDDAHAVEISATNNKAFVNRNFSESGGEGGGGGTTLPMKVTVKKAWADNNTSGKPNVTVILKENGTQVGSQVTLNAKNKWTYTWTGLTSDNTYTVEEVGVAGYVPSYSYTYSYDSTTETDYNRTNGALLYVKDGNYYVQATSSSSLDRPSSNNSYGSNTYIITNADRSKVLKITSAHADAELSSADAVSLPYDSANNRFAASDVPTDCQFKVFRHQRNGDTYVVYAFANQGVGSYLLLEPTANNYLKGGSSQDYCSTIFMDNGKLKGYVKWSSNEGSRYFIWDGNKFNTDTQIGYVTYEVTSGVTKNYTITNTKADTVTYKLHIRKCEQGNVSHVLSGATFQILSGNNSPISFTRGTDGRYTYTATNIQGSTTRLVSGTDGFIRISGMPAGTYTVRELSPPEGYKTAPDQTVTLGADTPNGLLNVQFEDRGSSSAYVLPESGGSGVFLLYLAGALLTAVSLTTFVRLYRRSKR